MTYHCPGCEAEWTGGIAEKGEIIVCPDCAIELEVKELDPLKLEPAPQEEEDWGE